MELVLKLSTSSTLGNFVPTWDEVLSPLPYESTALTSAQIGRKFSLSTCAQIGHKFVLSNLFPKWEQVKVWAITYRVSRGTV